MQCVSEQPAASIRMSSWLVFQHATAQSQYSSGLGFAALEIVETNGEHSRRVQAWTVSVILPAEHGWYAGTSSRYTDY